MVMASARATLVLLLLLGSLPQPAAMAPTPNANTGRRRKPATSSGPAAEENGAILFEAGEGHRIEVTYATTSECIERWMIRECDNASVLGFDTESRPSYHKGEVYPPALVQLSTATATLVIHLLHLDVMPPVLVDTLASDAILKVGVGVDDDAIDLWLHHRLDVNARLDLSRMGASEKPSSLRALCEEVLGVRLDKSSSLTLTNWARRELSVEELQYAALDAWAGRAIHDELARCHDERIRAIAGDDAPSVDSEPSAGNEPGSGGSLPGASKLDGRARRDASASLAHLIGFSERSCAELYGYRLVRQSMRRQFIQLDAELSERGLPHEESPMSNKAKRRTAQVRRAIGRARADFATAFAAAPPRALPTGGTLPTGRALPTGGTLPTGRALLTGGALPTGGALLTGGTLLTGGALPTGGTGGTAGRVAVVGASNAVSAQRRKRPEAQRAAAKATVAYEGKAREVKLKRGRALQAAEEEARRAEGSRRVVERARRKRERQGTGVIS